MEVQRLMEHMDRGREGETETDKTMPSWKGLWSKQAENAKAQGN